MERPLPGQPPPPSPPPLATGLPPFGPAVAAALVLGVLACSRLPAPPSALPLVPLAALGVWAWWRFPDWRRAVGALGLGAALFGLHAAWVLERQLPPELERGDFAIRGRVVQLPEHEPRRTRFLFRVDRGAGQPEALRGKLLRLSWYDDRDGADSPRLDLAPGSRWQLTARLRAPRGLRNPGWYDGERHALAARLAATGYVRAGDPWQRLDAAVGIDAWRDRIANRIDAALAQDEPAHLDPAGRGLRANALARERAPGNRDPVGAPPVASAPPRQSAATDLGPVGATSVANALARERAPTEDGAADAQNARSPSRFVRALALGDTRGLDDVDWEILRATGLTHLIAISGFHVGLVAGFFALAVAGLWWLLPGLGRRLPRPQASACGALLGAIGYAAAAGFALPTVRTVLMIAVVVLARLWRRPMGVAGSLALAAIALLLADPLSVLAAGFWLSFAGVAWLAWCLPGMHAQPLLRGFLSAQWVATLGLLPLTAVLFGQASLAGPLANLVAIPWWSLVVVPLALVGTGLEALGTGWGGPAWRLAAWCFDLSWPLFERLAQGRLALWWLPEPHWLALPLALLGAFWLLLPRGAPGKALAPLLLLPLLWPDRKLPAPGDFELVVLDVGQGTSVLVRTAGHALLYDAGPALPEGFDAGERVVVPALHALGVRRLDAVVVSHGDADHAGGLEAVLRRFPAGPQFASRDAGVAGAAPCLAGSGWQFDGVRFSFLHPHLHFPAMRNESSCVLRIESRQGSALLAGDIGAVVERMLVHDRALLRSDVVLLAHHGSDKSSDPAFVGATQARVAVASAGHGNRFGHPHARVMQRWSDAGAATADSARDGAIRVRIGDATHIERHRSRYPRLWDAVRRADAER